MSYLNDLSFIIKKISKFIKFKIIIGLVKYYESGGMGRVVNLLNLLEV